MSLSKNALRVLRERYLKRDEHGKIVETPSELFWRVARNIAQGDAVHGASKKQVEKTASEFYTMMFGLDFLPNTPTLANAGKEIGQLSACFVLPVGDSLKEIFESVKLQAIIQQSGGGTGMNFSNLRPRGERVKSTMGVASGPVSFMKVFDSTTETIKQGSMRRGANMGILRVDHPDILEFISVKSDMKTLLNFNISVAVTDKFMQAVEKNRQYKLVNPRNGKVVAKLKARKVWNKIIQEAWRNGDPGVIFIDEINRHNPTPAIGKLEATNPCAEVTLLPYESCNLGSINVANFYDAKTNDVEWRRLAQTVHSAVHFLDNVIDVNRYPYPEIEEMTKGNRKIGLGVMGFAQLLFQLGKKYDSEEGVAFGEKLMHFVSQEADKASLDLGKQRGPFEFWRKSIYARAGKRFRNATRTCIAPTGTISMIANCSSGIEPIFAFSFVKTVMGGKKLRYADPFFAKASNKKSGVFVTAFDISPYWHVAMQAAFQKHTNLAVSKTINFPANATLKDVEQTYLLAYKMKCKGITIYRNKSREAQVLTLAD